MRPGCRRTLVVLAWAALVSSLGACSTDRPADRTERPVGDASTSRAAATPDVSRCDLLTAGEVEAAMGVAPGRAEPDTSLRGCDWNGADGRPLIGVVTSVAHRTYDEYMQNLREQVGSDLEGFGMNRVEGVGDYAIWHEEEGANYLNAVKDGRLLVIGVYRQPEGERSKKEAAIQLARHALPRL